MNTPHLRIMRAEARELLGDRCVPTARAEKREQDILTIAERLMCSHGPAAVTLKILCSSLDITAAAMHRHFADIEELLGRLLLRHARALLDCVSKTTFETPDGGAAQRAAYLAYTRTAWGSLTDIHHLMLTYAATLPKDLAEPVATARRTIAVIVVGAEAPAAAMTLLDSTDLAAPEIEILLVALRAATGGAAASRAIPPEGAPPEQPPARILKLQKPKPALKTAAGPALPSFDLPAPPGSRQEKSHRRKYLLQTSCPLEKIRPPLDGSVFEARAGPA